MKRMNFPRRVEKRRIEALQRYRESLFKLESEPRTPLSLRKIKNLHILIKDTERKVF